MTGISEILTLVLIIICLLVLPRIFRGEAKSSKSNKKSLKTMSIPLRTAIVFSIIIPVAAALLIKPWDKNISLFIACGILPVAVGWAFFWILSGKKNK